MNYIIKLPAGDIQYTEYIASKFLKPSTEGTSELVIYPDTINYQNGILNYLSYRNAKNAFVIEMNKDKILNQILPQKKLIGDTNISYYIDNSFSYFTDDQTSDNSLENLFSLAEGLIFRFTEPLKSIDQYTYYIMGDDKIEKIPNFKTLEVMLSQRNQNYLSVRVIEKDQMNDLLKEFPIVGKEDMSSQWDPSLADGLNFANYLDLKQSAKAAGAIADAAAAEADKNIKAVKAEKDAEKAKAEQAKAEADAAKAKAEAAVEEAKAAQAKAQQAEAEAKQKEAEAKQKEAEAEAAKAEYESKGN